MFQRANSVHTSRASARIPAVAAALVMVAAACGSDGGGTTSAPPAATGAAPASDAATASDDEVVAAFVAALDTGDRAAAEALAPPEALIPFEPWEAHPGITTNYRDGNLFQVQPGPGWIVACTVGDGRVLSCEELFEGDPSGVPHDDIDLGVTPNDEAIDAFLAALAAGDRGAAEALAPEEAISLFDPWDPRPDIASQYRDEFAFQVQLGPGWIVFCSVADALVSSCQELSESDDGELDTDSSGTIAPGFAVVEFFPGDSSSITDGSLAAGQALTYLLNADAGSALFVSVSPSDSGVVHSVISPSGALLASDTTDSISYLPESGTYGIPVAATAADADFELFVGRYYEAEVVRFDPGTSGTTISGGVVRGDRNVYFLGAGAGQTMSLAITSLEDNAVFDVYPPSGPPIQLEATDADIVLPESGEYKIVVGGTRGNATFELTVSIV